MTEKPLAYATYQQFAEAYASKIDTKPHNAYYDRPAVLSLLPDIDGKHVLDAGCGPGVYSEEFVGRGASVTAFDVSENMLAIAEKRLRSKGVEDKVEFVVADLTRPLSMFSNELFDVVVAALCLDYVEDWRACFAEFYRVLKPGGCFIKSSGHPAFDAEFFNTDSYFSVEQVACEWNGFGPPVTMPSFRRSLEENLMPFIEVGFVIERVLEPLPTKEFEDADPIRFQRLMHRPGFLCVRATKPFVELWNNPGSP